jgi:hypothetical protein
MWHHLNRLRKEIYKIVIMSYEKDQVGEVCLIFVSVEYVEFVDHRIVNSDDPNRLSTRSG